MAMKKVYDAVVTTGKYTNKQGEEKKSYMTIGSVFENDKGALSLKLNAIPTEFNGWIAFYIPKEQQSEKPKGQAKNDFSDMDSEIPF